MGKRRTRASRRRPVRRAPGGIRFLVGVLSLILILCLANSGSLSASPSFKRQPGAPLAQVVVFQDSFESDLGWVRNLEGTDTATGGDWERAIPQPVSDSFGYMQISAYDGQYNLVTDYKAGANPDTNDVDGGVTSICSPEITLPSGTWDSITLSFRYYLAHRTNSSSTEGLVVRVVGQTTDTVLEEYGSAANDNAVWDLFSGGLSGFLGDKVRLCAIAADGGLTDSTVEAGIDAVQIVATDNTPPSSAASSPDYDNGGTIPVSFIASDGASGVDETCLWVMYETAGWSSSGLCASGASGTFYFNPTSGDGTYYFYTVAVDNLGNGESTPSGGGDDSTFRDTAAPSATVSAPPLSDSLSWLVSWTGTDPTPPSGVASYDVQYKVDTAPTWSDWLLGTALTSATFGPNTPLVVTPEHTYWFQVRANDLAGNAGAYSTAVSTYVQLQKVYLPLTLNAYSPLTNGGFEDGWVGWTHGGSLPQAIVTEYAHSGSYSARLGDSAGNCAGGVPIGTAWVEQIITIPSTGVGHLRIYYRIISEDHFVSDQWDRFEIWLNGSRLFLDGDHNPQGCDPGPKIGSWLYHDVDVSGYPGQNVTLRLVNVSVDDWFRTWTYVDDIQLVP